MEKIISNWANIAGIGGIVLAVFLILFYKIKLPEGSKKHLTLYMFLVWSVCIFGVFIYFYLQSSYSTKKTELEKKVEEKNIIPQWKKDFINISGWDKNKEFIAFLEENRGKIIYLSTSIDMSITGTEDFEGINLSQVGKWEDESNNLELQKPYTYGGIDKFREDSSLSLPLDGSSDQSSNFLKLNLINGRDLPFTEGGTGIHVFPIEGYFKVQSLGRSGPSTIYELTEIQTNLTITP